MKTTMRSLTLMVVLSMLLAACGDGGESTDTTTGGTSGETTETTTAPDTTSGEAGATSAPETTSGEAAATTAPADTSAPEETTAAVEPASVTFATGAATIAPKEEVAAYAVPKALGYFEEEGLTVDLITADGSTASLQAVASGSATFSSAGGGPILAAVASDVPVQAVGGLVVNWPWRMGVLPDSDIEAPEDLLGSNIGIISLASGSNPYARAFITAAGGAPDADAQYVPVGLGPSAAAALTDGQVDTLALFTQAFASMENAGLELRYLENPDVFDPLFSLTWAVTDDFLAESPDVAARFLRAAYKGLLFSHANPEVAMRIGYAEFPELLGDETDPEARIEADTAVLESWLITTAPAEGDPSSWGDWGALSDEDWAAVEEFTINAGTIEEPVPLEEVWSPELLEGANDWDRQEVLDDAANYQPPG